MFFSYRGWLADMLLLQIAGDFAAVESPSSI